MDLTSLVIALLLSISLGLFLFYVQNKLHKDVFHFSVHRRFDPAKFAPVLLVLIVIAMVFFMLFS